MSDGNGSGNSSGAGKRKGGKFNGAGGSNTGGINGAGKFNGSGRSNTEEDEQQQRDTESVENNCKYFTEFIKNVKSRENVGMSRRSMVAIEKLRGEMFEFLSSTGDKNKDDTRRNTVVKQEKEVPEGRKDRTNKLKPRDKFSGSQVSHSTSETENSSSSEDEKRFRNRRRKKYQTAHAQT